MSYCLEFEIGVIVSSFYILSRSDQWESAGNEETITRISNSIPDYNVALSFIRIELLMVIAESSISTRRRPRDFRNTNLNSAGVWFLFLDIIPTLDTAESATLLQSD